MTAAYALHYTLKDFDRHSYSGEDRLWWAFLKVIAERARNDNGSS